MIITLKSYLAELEKEEQFRPATKRRDVPTITALAKEIGVSRAQFHKMLANQTKSLKLDIADNIIKAMRERGFNMDVSDLLEYRD